MAPGRRRKENHPVHFNSEVLKKAIQGKGWNGAYLRRLLQLYDVNPKVDQIMNGHRCPSGPTAALMAHLLDVPLGDFYSIDESLNIGDAINQIGPPRLRRGRPRKDEQGASTEVSKGAASPGAGAHPEIESSSRPHIGLLTEQLADLVEEYRPSLVVLEEVHFELSHRKKAKARKLAERVEGYVEGIKCLGSDPLSELCDVIIGKPQFQKILVDSDFVKEIVKGNPAIGEIIRQSSVRGVLFKSVVHHLGIKGAISPEKPLTEFGCLLPDLEYLRGRLPRKYSVKSKQI